MNRGRRWISPRLSQGLPPGHRPPFGRHSSHMPAIPARPRVPDRLPPRMASTVDTHALVAQSLRLKPIIGVVRTATTADAARQAQALAKAGIELIEITFTVPGAAGLARQLLAERGAAGPPWIGMGTVTNAARAREA